MTRTQVRIASLWADTKEDNWIHAHAEMYARQVHLPGNLESILAKQTMELSTLIRQSGVPSDFVRYAWTAKAEYEMHPPPASRRTHLQGTRPRALQANSSRTRIRVSFLKF